VTGRADAAATHHHAEAVEVALEDVLAQGAGGRLRAPRAQVGHGRPRLLGDSPAGDALDVAQHAVLARRCQSDRLHLNARGFLVAEFGEGGHQLVTQPRVAEGWSIDGCIVPGQSLHVHA